MPEKSTHGGKRDGAGRHPSPPEQLLTPQLVRVPLDVLPSMRDDIGRAAKKAKKTRNAYLRDIIQRANEEILRADPE
jgi:hypothetical protein